MRLLLSGEDCKRAFSPKLQCLYMSNIKIELVYPGFTPLGCSYREELISACGHICTYATKNIYMTYHKRLLNLVCAFIFYVLFSSCWVIFDSDVSSEVSFVSVPVLLVTLASLYSPSGLLVFPIVIPSWNSSSFDAFVEGSFDLVT